MARLRKTAGTSKLPAAKSNTTKAKAKNVAEVARKDAAAEIEDENVPEPAKKAPGRPRKNATASKKAAPMKATGLRMNVDMHEDEDMMDIDDEPEPTTVNPSTSNQAFTFDAQPRKRTKSNSRKVRSETDKYDNPQWAEQVDNISGKNNFPMMPKQRSLPAELEGQKEGESRGTKRKRASTSSSKTPSKRLRLRNEPENEDKAPANIPAKTDFIQLYMKRLDQAKPINPSQRWLGEGPRKGFEFDENGNLVERQTKRQRALADTLVDDKKDITEFLPLERPPPKNDPTDPKFQQMVKQRTAYLEQLLNRDQIFDSLVKNVKAVIETYKRDGHIVPYVKTLEEMTDEEILEDEAAKKPGGYGDDYTYWFGGKQITRYQMRTWRHEKEIWMEPKWPGPMFMGMSSTGGGMPRLNDQGQIIEAKHHLPTGFFCDDLEDGYVRSFRFEDGTTGGYVFGNSIHQPAGTYVQDISVNYDELQNYSQEDWDKLFSQPHMAKYDRTGRIRWRSNQRKLEKNLWLTPRMSRAKYRPQRKAQFNPEYLLAGVLPCVNNSGFYFLDIACRFQPGQADPVVNNPQPVIFKALLDTGCQLASMPMCLWTALCRRWQPHSIAITNAQAVVADGSVVPKSIVNLQFHLIQNGVFLGDWIDVQCNVPQLQKDGWYSDDDCRDHLPLAGGAILKAMNWLFLKDRDELLFCSSMKAIRTNVQQGFIKKFDLS